MLKYWQMYDATIVGRSIRGAREAQGLSPSELARRIGKHHSHIPPIENGTIIAGWDVLAKIADVLGLSLDALLERQTILDKREQIAGEVLALVPDDYLSDFEDHVAVWLELPYRRRRFLTEVGQLLVADESAHIRKTWPDDQDEEREEQ